ncbi:flagellar hook-associated protein FlgL [Ferrimonas lipolytica]|uniref:Flagellar hook-associated protein FlgL n=1 Tax=Ferrimonas lipolytica TaxID=2724191 RepID=A0A6H1UDV8_9GAMM|nr:flagellar hook-associated protein FlgL [Ferrimonas lipolytica]QIZ76780.1 flagellar hook-associated protein FlgL [Ferrimonas lipolytica]
MRVASQQLYTSSVYSMQQTTQAITDTMLQMSYGKSILAPSDDPIGAVKVMGLESDTNQANQYLDNISTLSDYYGRAESTLLSMNDTLLRATEIVTAAGSSTTTAEGRQAYAEELRSIQSSLVDFANSQDDNGNYLFAGNATTTEPVTIDSNGDYVYAGNSDTREVPISESSSLEVNYPGDELFFSGTNDIFNELNDYIEVLEDPTLSPGDPQFDAAQAEMTAVLDETRGSINSAMTSMGSKQNTLTMMETHHKDMVLYNSKVIGETEDLDYAEAMTDYTQNLTVLQATQSTYVKIANLSLFNEM